MEVEKENFDPVQDKFDPVPLQSSSSDPPIVISSPDLPPTTQPKVQFERGISKDHPNAVEGVLKKISDLKIPDLSVAELLSISPSVAEGMKKWVSRRRVEVGPEEMKVSSGTLLEDSGGTDPLNESSLYSCPLGFLSCYLGDSDKTVSLLVDSGSQLNLISDSMACKLKLSPRVSFNSSVYGISNQSCELVGIAEDVTP